MKTTPQYTPEQIAKAMLARVQVLRDVKAAVLADNVKEGKN